MEMIPEVVTADLYLILKVQIHEIQFIEGTVYHWSDKAFRNIPVL